MTVTMAAQKTGIRLTVLLQIAHTFSGRDQLKTTASSEAQTSHAQATLSTQAHNINHGSPTK